jgi:hypothetical protein
MTSLALHGFGRSTDADSESSPWARGAKNPPPLLEVRSTSLFWPLADGRITGVRRGAAPHLFERGGSSRTASHHVHADEVGTTLRERGLAVGAISNPPS